MPNEPSSPVEQSSMQINWADEYLVTSYEVDPKGQLPLHGLGKFLQETAYNHAKHLEFGYEHLNEKKLFWVLSRLIVKVEKYPKWLDKIYVHTWPAGVEGLLAYRDFEVVDSDGNIIANAVSAWLILDSEKRRPQRMDVIKDRFPMMPEKRALDQNPGKLPNPVNPETSELFPVRYSDLDLYDHVNNAQYMQWVLDNYPLEIHQNFEIATFEINFQSESHLGDEIYIDTEKLESDDAELVFLHSIKRKADARTVCQSRVTWRKK